MHRLVWRFVAVVGFQFLILLSVIGFKQFTVWTGETVLLQVRPVDPRSLFRGDYVRLSYDISTLSLDQLGGDDGFGFDQIVYVELAEGDDGCWHAVAAWRKRRDVADGHVLIKGSTDERTGFFERAQLRVNYGVEEVFVPEGSGRAVETSTGQLGVQVKVDRFGNAVPRRIFIDGEPFPLKRKG